MQEYENVLNLSDLKTELANESIFVVEYNLKKLNEIIDSFDSNIKNQVQAQTDISKVMKNTLEKLNDGFLNPTPGKISKKTEEIKDEKLLKRKKCKIFLSFSTYI